MANKKTAIEKAEQDWQYMKDYAKKHPLDVKKPKSIAQILADREERSKSQHIDNSKE